MLKEGLLLANAVSIIVFMTAMFFLAKQRGRLDTVDLAWGPAFVIAASLVAGYDVQGRTVLIALLVDIWGVRLTSHILERAKTSKEDPRYKDISKKWKGSFWLRAYFSIFLLQGVLVWLISLPVVTASGKGSHASLYFMITGTLVWVAGFVVELVADRQLAHYLKAHKGVMQTGLWRYSRHPNYFGEIVQWFGIGIIACGARNGWLGLAGPLVLAFIIIFVSGIPPIEKRHASDLSYQKYKRRTSPLIPWFPKS